MKRKKIALFVLLDIISIILAWNLPFLILGQGLANPFLSTYWCMGLEIAVMLISFYFMGMYNIINKFTGLSEIVKMLISIGIIAFIDLTYVIVFKVLGWYGNFMSFAWAFISVSIFAIFILVTRYSQRIHEFFVLAGKPKENDVKVVIIGAGHSGAAIVREMKSSIKLHYNPVCFLDDDEKKQEQIINGVEVVGKIKDVEDIVDKYSATEIIIAIPSIDRKKRAEIVSICQRTRCKLRFLPAMYQLVNEQVSVAQLKEVSISDLLGREQVAVDLDQIIGYIENKVILVTGGGGSIGSELCRQIATHNPKQLIIFDIYENNAYDIQQELKRKYGNKLNLKVLIGSVRDRVKLESLFSTYKPEIVFHAAAHKHVPLMEDSPNEAVKNNVCGTLNVAKVADKYNVKKFVLISTDKAVNPTNIMGATKRICEMIIQTINRHSKTEYVAVRFGNVLGSNGSVIPLFKKQIEAGGPITVTHKDIVRYFMTISEAVSLILQAGAYAKSGEIFVLDMGDPVKIYDLAVNMVRLSGLIPFKDIDIVVTGLRPGEKLYEERLMAEEGLKKTENKLISIGMPLKIDEENLFNKLDLLYQEAYNETDKMKQLVHELVPTYVIDEREKAEKKYNQLKDTTINKIVVEKIDKKIDEIA